MYITTEGVKSERAPEDSSKITMQATGALSWRKADVKYRKNEAFVDVIEDVNLLLSAAGTVLRADVTGQIVMRAYLSGTPECKFGLNDRLLLDNDGQQSLPSGNRQGSKATKAAAGSVTLEDCQFHQCVKLGKFDSDRIISFVPPDGEFELMRYRATENVNLPFKVHAIVNEVGKTKVEYSILVRSNFGSKLFATNVVVRIPTPLNTARITERCTQGKAKYEPSENHIVWKIGRFTGQSEIVLSAEAELTSMTNQKVWSRPPVSMSFSLLMFTSSGLLVRYLKVFEKSQYSSVKWVRYMTRAGSYEIRYVNLPRLRRGDLTDMFSQVLIHAIYLHPCVLRRSVGNDGIAWRLMDFFLGASMANKYLGMRVSLNLCSVLLEYLGRPSSCRRESLTPDPDRLVSPGRGYRDSMTAPSGKYFRVTRPPQAASPDCCPLTKQRCLILRLGVGTGALAASGHSEHSWTGELRWRPGVILTMFTCI